MQLSTTCTSKQFLLASNASRIGRSRQCLVVHARAGKGKTGKAAGFVAEDNSGRANIFAVEPKTLYTSSPTADRAARQGLGGLQGLAVVGGALAIIALTTLGIARSPDSNSSLQAAAGMASGESLASIAARVAASD